MKKFEQLKRLYNTMNAEYAKYSNEKTFVAAVTSDLEVFQMWDRVKDKYLNC